MQIRITRDHSFIIWAIYKSNYYKSCVCWENDTQGVQKWAQTLWWSNLPVSGKIEDVNYRMMLLIVKAYSNPTSDISFHTEGNPTGVTLFKKKRTKFIYF